MKKNKKIASKIISEIWHADDADDTDKRRFFYRVYPVIGGMTSYLKRRGKMRGSKNPLHTLITSVASSLKFRYLFSVVESRRDDTLLTVDFNLRRMSDIHTLQSPAGTILPADKYQWACNRETYSKRLAENRIVFKKGRTGQWSVFYKIYLNEEKGKLKFDENGNTMMKGKNISSVILNPLYREGNMEIKELFDSYPFSYPKPVALIKTLLQSSTDKNSVVLDFFSGSATTAHAVMQLNAEDGGNRKFIMVQLPELTPENSEAKKAGYINICEIGKERIRRAGEKIFHELTKNSLFAGTASKLDFGFKVFKIKNI